MILKKDCRHFKGDKPCTYHKSEGVHCEDCNYYQPVKFKILIIKLDAAGDVLRTTSILQPLKRKYPESYIEWCTRQPYRQIFKNNALVDEVISVEDDAFFRINAGQYDIVINLDTSKLSSAIAAIADSKVINGFLLNERGYVESTSTAAEQWLIMSAFDDVKKANKKSYQQIIYEILNLDLPVEPPVITISDKEKTKIASQDFTKEIDRGKSVIGLNVGVGRKWLSKGWPVKRWRELIKMLDRDKYNLLLLGGTDESEVISLLKKDFAFLVETSCDNSLTEFAAIVDLCNLIITADTLALHVATALGKKIIALFGPTSANEIELYGKGVKLIAEDECKCYYKKYCTEKVSCMEKITAERVIQEVGTLMNK
jgi:ADP-heptose:LPS heptosyltransferase